MWFFILSISSLILLDVRAQDPFFYTVFQPNDGKYPCYRQPAIITTNAERTHLIVFAEGRFVSASSCAPPFDTNQSSTNENGGLEMRRSVDSGMTWSSAQTIFSGNIDFYTVVWDSNTNLIYLMLETSSNILIFTSDDEGNTWSNPIPLDVHPPLPFNKVSRPAVGHGIEIIDSLCAAHMCIDNGSLLMPFICMNGSSHSKDNDVCASCHSCILKGSMISSTNNSRVWNFTGITQEYTRESQLVQILDQNRNVSSIYLNARNFSPQPGHRYFARSIDGGSQFNEFGLDRGLIEPVTKGWTGAVCSVARLSVQPSRIIFSGPANETIRANLTLQLSYDEAHSWSVSRVLFPGLSAYSDIAVLNDGKDLALVFENGEKTFADRISVAIVSTEWIENTNTKANKI